MVNRKIRADAEMKLGGELFYVELDTASETLAQYRRRQRAYKNVRSYLLFVTLSEDRMQNLIEDSDAIKTIALFTTLDATLADPHGEVWIDYEGNRVAI